MGKREVEEPKQRIMVIDTACTGRSLYHKIMPEQTTRPVMFVPAFPEDQELWPSNKLTTDTIEGIQKMRKTDPIHFEREYLNKPTIVMDDLNTDIKPSTEKMIEYHRWFEEMILPKVRRDG